MLTNFHLDPKLHKELKQTSEANNTPIAKILKTLILLFLNDASLQNRVLREVNHK
jgi:hypothetical protein